MITLCTWSHNKVVSAAFTNESDLFLEMSSRAIIIIILYIYILLIPSLSRDRPNTKIRGATAENGFNGDNMGIDCMTAINKKYMFAYRLNYRNRAIGKKFNKEYLDVLMKFEGNYSISSLFRCPSNLMETLRGRSKVGHFLENILLRNNIKKE